jgi:Fe-S-cluster containining protein
MVHVLRFHAGYRCRHAGVCCTEDWPIPVEAPIYRRLAQALESSALRPEFVGATYFEPAHGLAAGEPVVTGRVGRDCAFFEPGRGRLCAIHEQLGHDHLPSACQHFPRVVTIDPRGVFVSLSHVCPTAGRLLREPSVAPFDIVHEGPVVTPGLIWTGLDAREALPPQVGRDVLWDWDALTVWERGILRLLDRLGPERALSALKHAARQLERWRPGGDITLASFTESALDAAGFEPGPCRIDIAALDAIARQAATDGFSLHAAAFDRAAADRELVEPAWEGQGPLVVRYLAARTVANAVGYHAASARVWAASLDTAYAVLRTEAARQAARADRVLDADLLVAAAAAADRLLVHRVEAARLAASLAALPS